MGAGEAILLILEALDTVWSLGSFLTGGDEITHETVYNFTGSCWVGQAYYTYTLASGESDIETCFINFNPNQMKDGFIFMQGQHVVGKAIANVGTTQPYVDVSSSGIRMFWDSVGAFKPVYESQSGQGAYGASTGVTSGNVRNYVYYVNSTRSFPAGGANYIAVTSDSPIGDQSPKTIITTSQALREQYPTVTPYVPEGQYTFDELRAELIQQFNINFDLDISVSTPEIPDLGDYLGEEPSETGDGSGFVFDYDEVISPEELEEILGQETYDWDEVETDLIELPDLPTVPAFETDALESEVLKAIPVVATVSYNMLDQVGLLATLSSLAIFAVVMAIIRKKG